MKEEQISDDYRKSMALGRMYLILLRKKGKVIANNAINSFLKGVSEKSPQRAESFKQSIIAAIKVIHLAEEQGELT